MDNLRDRLTTALMDYGAMPDEICVADLADYLIRSWMNYIHLMMRRMKLLNRLIKLWKTTL